MEHTRSADTMNDRRRTRSVATSFVGVSRVTSSIGSTLVSSTGGVRKGHLLVGSVHLCGIMGTVSSDSVASNEHSERHGMWRRGTAVARGGSWLAFLVAGVIVLAAMPFYRFLGPTSSSTGCTSVGDGFICRAHLLSNGFFGMGLGSSAPGIFGNSSPSATTYWVISIFLGTGVTVGFFWVRSRRIGKGGRLWPLVTVGLGALVLGLASRNWFSIAPTEMSIRGMQALLIICLGLIVLALIDHQWAVTLFVTGFLGLALLSCLYDVSNVFSRFGLGSRWPANDRTLPNLLVPGIYLLIGGVVFWVIHHKEIRTFGKLEPRS